MRKHAYLIVGHNNFEVMKSCLRCLDHERNVFYVHIDRKVKMPPWDDLRECVKRGELIFMPRLSIGWGGDNEMRVNIVFLQQATSRNFAFYHYISGVDMPLRPVDEILRFFDSNPTRSLIDAMEVQENNRLFADRVRYYHFWQNFISRGVGSPLVVVIRKTASFLVKLQQVLGINRIRALGVHLYRSSAYFSLTHEMAEYICANVDWIHKVFDNSFIPVEHWCATVAMRGPFRDKIDHNNRRYIVFCAGNSASPRILCISDFNNLIASDSLFARKFDEKSMEVVHSLEGALRARSIRG